MKTDGKTTHVGKCSQHKQNVVLLCMHKKVLMYVFIKCLYELHKYTDLNLADTRFSVSTRSHLTQDAYCKISNLMCCGV